jgi:SAM-dependent methyltransferase
MDRLEELAAGATTIGVLAVADRSGLLASLADRGPATPAELAASGFDGRLVEEILAALAVAGVVETSAERYYLPPEHAACLTDDSSPYLLAGWLDLVSGCLEMLDEVTRATREGGGVPPGAYPPRVVAGIDRLNSPGTRVLLTKRWLPAMPDVVAKLEEGARVLDFGCGGGTAAVAIAEAFPRSSVIGIDVDERALELARRRKGDLPNVSFAKRPDIDGVYDLITAFDVIHDLPQPLDTLQSIKDALAPGGTFLMVEPAAGAELDGARRPRDLLLLGVSVLHCLPQSLVGGGAGLGTAWGPVRAEALCRKAGFSTFVRLAIDNPYSNFFRVER